MKESEKEWYDRLEAEIIEEIESDNKVMETQIGWLMSKKLRRDLIRIISWTAVRTFQNNVTKGSIPSTFVPITGNSHEGVGAE